MQYDDINDWTEGCSPAEHWGFHQPIHKEYSESISCEYKDDVMVYSPKTEKISEAYWGLNKVTTKSFPLTEISSGNLNKTVFGTFEVL